VGAQLAADVVFMRRPAHVRPLNRQARDVTRSWRPAPETLATMTASCQVTPCRRQHHARDGIDEPSMARASSSGGGGQAVALSSRLRCAFPTGPDPPALEPMERRVERAVLTCSTSCVVCWMYVAMARPWTGPKAASENQHVRVPCAAASARLAVHDSRQSTMTGGRDGRRSSIDA
jgi:hypothetical protein